MAGVVTPHEYVKRVAGHLVQKMLKPLEELDRPGKVQPGSPAERVRQTLIAGYELLCGLMGSIEWNQDRLLQKGMSESFKNNINEAYGYIVHARDPQRWNMVGKAKYHVFTPDQRLSSRLARQRRQPPGNAEPEALEPPFSGLADEDEERVHRLLSPETDAVPGAPVGWLLRGTELSERGADSSDESGTETAAVPPRPPAKWLSRMRRSILSERGTYSSDEGGSPLEAEGAAD